MSKLYLQHSSAQGIFILKRLRALVYHNRCGRISVKRFIRRLRNSAKYIKKRASC